MTAPVKRVRVRNNDGSINSVRKRSIYVLATIHWGRAIEAIVNQLALYHEQVKIWKNNSYKIFGYARKSAMPSTDEDTRLDCLNRMVGVLRDRSNVDKMYVSWSTNSSAPFGARDNNGYDVKTACCCDGDTQ
ncbi:hypothetical protein DFQ30_005189, partial [Apophysomyces sp. BC1015]